MEWSDEGIIIGARRHGETSVILEAMTRGHGRHLGLVRGGRSKRMQPLLQPGNMVSLTWRARLEEHLGFYAVETTRIRAAELMGAATSLHGLNHLGALLRLLAEREPNPALYAAADTILDHLADMATAAPLLVRLEAALLAESGFGLDLGRCAATGQRADLIYVSPKTGRAVSRGAGEPYRDRLLPLPGFVVEATTETVPLDEVLRGFELTGFFLARDVFMPRGMAMPDSRTALIQHLDSARRRAIAD